MEKYNKETKQCEPLDSKMKQQLQPFNLSTRPLSQSPIDIRHIHKLNNEDITSNIDQRLVKYFTQLLKDSERACSIGENVCKSLNSEELEIFAAHLETLKFKTVTPTQFDDVTSGVVSKLKTFVVLIKARNITTIEHLEETNKGVFQELREAFMKGEILKNRLKDYFLVLYGVNLSAKIVLKELRIIESKLFLYDNLKNKKKALASYLLP
ncbi:hypothetical protein [Candidatus Sulfurimonas baltica]|uniref:Uncharacterized protein n=1 Tax=Candidatus Sulfurimonas baltica TaxID=2740404 RepID=A0A7S7RNY9_9BACT|nr:hypothetical protein [Candidatus Sulfurimonas baltica]QOY53039.1 hypothetical protein HUE88_04980 [Candidatus Sulfurimonas baltica]